MQRNERMIIYQQFLTMINQRASLDLNPQLSAFLDYSQYSIKSQVDKTNKKPTNTKKKKDLFGERILEAYNSQTTVEKIQEYIRIVKFLKELKRSRVGLDNVKGERVFQDVFSLSYGLRVWKKKVMKVDMTAGHMFLERDKKVKFYDLRNYLIRESKNTDYKCFVLEAINTKPYHKAFTVRVGFKSQERFKECLECVKRTVHKMEGQRIKEGLGLEVVEVGLPEGVVEGQTTMKGNGIQQKEQRVGEKVEGKEQQDDIAISSFRSQIKKGEDSEEQQQDIRTISLSLLDCDNSEEMYSIVEKEGEIEDDRKKNLDVFHQIVPDYELSHLEDEMQYELEFRENRARILRHKEQPYRYKLFIDVDTENITLIFQTLTRVENYTKWNPAVEEALIKSILRTENVAILYQKHKAMNKVYRARDFVFMRHTFKMDNNLYFLDKSIENASYPPFLTIVRGDMQIVWGIIKKEKGHLIVCDVEMQNEGYINKSQNHSLSMLYLKGLVGVQQYLKSGENVEIECNIFNLDWDISKNSIKNKNKFQAKMMESGEQSFKKMRKKKDKEEVEQKLKEEEEESQVKQVTKASNQPDQQLEKPNLETKVVEEVTDSLPQVHPPSKQCLTSIQYKLGSDGLVLIPQQYLRNRFLLSFEHKKPVVYQEAIEGHPIWKGEWRVDTKNGGIIFINQEKINDQKGVLKFILSKIAKNLLSGKSVLNISLPVDIFGYETNLERLALSMTYAPIMLERAASLEDPIERFKIVTGFGLTNSAIYLSMEKPFNSILGETFQGWMNGCPIYMEQISHHPPIAAFLLLGRGYKLTGTLESKVELHMNSGCGTNAGIYRIMMDDGSDYNFITPGGEIAGISYGDRKFNLVGKYYVWSKKHRLFLELQMDPCSKKGFLSKREHPTDYMQGQLKEVSLQFLTQFQAKKEKEREGPNKVDTLRVLQKVDGTWHKSLYFNKKQYLNIDTDFGCKLEYDQHLLPSDGNWREDLIYRRRKDIVRAQTEKQRLENLQRKDRKLREKASGSKH